MKRLVLRISLALFFSENVLAGPAPTTHHLAPTPKTVTWGYFDPSTPPVLRVHSGDTVEVETLPGGGIQALEEAGLPRSRVQPALLEVEREVKERGEVPHILTGPIWIEDAEPGDVLEVHIVSVELTVPYAWNGIMPGRGFLPDDFPHAHFKLTPLDLAQKVARFADGIVIPLQPFFGVMGVASPIATGRISSGPPWIHTGNMDNKELVAGTTLYLPVHVKGALFSVGDGHAGQGDAKSALQRWKLP
jgi:acetamidase/formamidase